MKHTLHDHMGGYVLAHHTHAAAGSPQPAPSVTISREAGAGGSTVAHRLAGLLGLRRTAEEPEWKVYDHDLVEEMLRRHRLPRQAGEYLPEDAAHLLPDTVEDLLGLHPAASEMVRRLSETMLGMARGGHVILVGRGSNLATARLPDVLHVRLVASQAQRVRHMQEIRRLSHAEADALVARLDRGRRRFVRQNFGVRIEDPVNYHLVLNTGRLGFERTAEIVADAVRALRPAFARQE